MKKQMPDIICGLLIVLFVYAAVTKLMNGQHFKEVLSKMLLIGGMSSFIAIFLPLTELLISALLAIPVTRLKGLYASLFLLLLFTLYIGYMILFAKNLPCNCGGILEKMSWHQDLVFNFFFIILSITGIKLYRTDKNIIAIQRQPDQPPQGKS